MVVDEEQRFGVEHKEHIKALRTHVDVLTMSRHPDPAHAGDEPGRHPRDVDDHHPARGAPPDADLRRRRTTTSRSPRRSAASCCATGRSSTCTTGSASIDAGGPAVRELVPEARVAVAHGQMNEDRLERTVDGFWDREFDVLVCTTIVETGLDISNANTLIVERADTLGLSQLHQLRGRVGRGRERGYAYFLYPPEHPLTETAHDRLATIAQNSDLGAGMAVAMKDLEIRGAGNILGAEQSGHIAGVGFDLYVRLVGEAVAAFRTAAGARRGRRGRDAGRGAGRPAGRRARPARLHHRRPAAAGGLPQDRRGAGPGRARRDRRGADRPLRRAADTGAQPARRRRVPAALPGAWASPRSRSPGTTSGSARWTCRTRRSCGCGGCTRRRSTSRRRRLVTVPRPVEGGRIGGAPLRDVALLDWCATLIGDVLASPVAART